MGKCPHNKSGGQKKKYSHKRARLTKFLKKGDDIVYDALKEAGGEEKKLQVDEDLPGMGQWYCLHCDRYFATAQVRDEHNKTKPHKKKAKQMQGARPHNQLDADLAGGMGAPDNGPRLTPSDAPAAMAF